MDSFRASSGSQRLLTSDEDFVLLSEKRRNQKALDELNNNKNNGMLATPRKVTLHDHISKSISNTDSMIY